MSPSCPFCAIAHATPPSSIPFSPSSSPATNTPPSPQAHILLSTPTLLAFLDHAPISRGHVLLVVRQHREKLGDLRVEEGEALGRWLGVLSRAVVGSVSEDEDVEGFGEEGGDGVLGEGEGDVGDWNVVQNNGARAAQVVPHVHYHIIPRVGDVPEVKARSWTVFGKGQREDLDEGDAEVLVGRMRGRLRGEIERVRRREGEEGVRRLLGEGGVDGVVGRGRGSKL